MSQASLLSFSSISENASLLSYVTSVTLVLLILGQFYYTYKFKFFSRKGMKNPPPRPLVGNLLTIMLSDRMVLERDWTRLYGKFYGVFHGLRPRYVINDADLMRQICVRDFDSFPNHDAHQLLNVHQKGFLFFLQDDRWKRIRAMQSPTFTSGKMRRMYRLLERCADDLVECFSDQLDKDGHRQSKAIVHLKDIYSLFTMDAIMTAAYQIKLERKRASDLKSAATRNRFVELALRLFEVNMPRLFCTMIVPTWILRSLGFKSTPTSKMDELVQRVEQILKQRRESGKKYDDYLQILVDAKLDAKLELDQTDELENHHSVSNSESLQGDQEKLLKDLGQNGHSNGSTTLSKVGKKMTNGTKQTDTMTDEEVVSSALFLLMVGLETTATLLTNCTYALAFHQEVQEKLYQTIKSIAQVDPKTGECTFDYDTLTSCQYLDAVISETLRALSPVIQLDRIASRDYYVEKYKVTIKKGEKLLLNFYGIMNNPEYWHEPTKFEPERFMPGQKENIVPYSYVPFGVGPRHCLGMRFSLTESKLALARVIMKYKFLHAPGTSYPPENKPALGLNSIKSPLAELVLRE